MFTVSYDVLNPRFWMEMTIWGILLGTFVSLVGAYGSDQVLVQRYIAAGSARRMAQSLIFAAVLQIPVSIILYALGLGFFAYYHAPENSALLRSLDELVARTGDSNMILPHFVRNALPSGLAGLVFAGLFAATMSVFSSGLNSLSTVTCIDFMQRLRQRRENSQDVTLENAQWITLAWGVVVTLAAIGVYFAHIGSLLEAAAAVIGFFSGPLLGMFLLGMFSMRATSPGAILGAVCGFVTALVLRNHVSFIWYPVAGCVPTVMLGYLLSYLTPGPTKDVYPMTVWGRRSSLSLSSLDLTDAAVSGEQA
jgi:sodium-coupled monocarboxylate transporter 8/12